jgi:hypothetical protein
MFEDAYGGYMLGRFTVRPADDGSATFGVWDSAVSGWRGTDLTEQQAHTTATDLDVQYDAHGPSPATSEGPRVCRTQNPLKVLFWKRGRQCQRTAGRLLLNTRMRRRRW